MTPPDWSRSGALWSLLDMLKISAAEYIALGQSFGSMRDVFVITDEAAPDDPSRHLSENEKTEFRTMLREALAICETVGLTTSQFLLSSRIENLPKTGGELEILVEAVLSELSSHLFLFIPPHRARYHETNLVVAQPMRDAFPLATQEMIAAGNCFAAAQSDACVFHSMRAVEHGLRALATDVGLTFDVQQWQNGIPGLDKATKDARLQFLSEAAKEFAYFKDGWRNYVSHAKVPYSEQQALSSMKHVGAFMEQLSKQLKEA